jgi:hypothetical protein
MSGHTKEPWVYACGDAEHLGIIIGRHGGEVVDGEFSEANARRIVACVNACAGIPDEKLQSWMNPPEGQLGAPHGTWAQQLFEVGEQMIQLQRERNELLAVMKKAAAGLEKDGDEFGIASELSAAIAKAEGTA